MCCRSHAAAEGVEIVATWDDTTGLKYDSVLVTPWGCTISSANDFCEDGNGGFAEMVSSSSDPVISISIVGSVRLW